MRCHRPDEGQGGAHMLQLDRDSRLIGTIAIATAIVAGIYIASHSWERVRNKPKDRTLKITGSAKKRINADLIQWSGTISTQDMDRTAAYRSVHEQMNKTRAYLE